MVGARVALSRNPRVFGAIRSNLDRADSTYRRKQDVYLGSRSHAVRSSATFKFRLPRRNSDRYSIPHRTRSFGRQRLIGGQSSASDPLFRRDSILSEGLIVPSACAGPICISKQRRVDNAPNKGSDYGRLPSWKLLLGPELERQRRMKEAPKAVTQRRVTRLSSRPVEMTGPALKSIPGVGAGFPRGPRDLPQRGR